MRYTLIIPVAPERECPIIESIKQIDYPKNEFHVVVVRGRNPSENRNKGVEKSKGDIVVFLDDDAIVSKDFLIKADKFFLEHPEIDIVGGPQLTPSEDSDFGKVSGYALSSKFGAWKISNRYSGKNLVLDADETMLTSANMICKKKVFEKVKFNPDLFPGEDPDFISKAKKSRYKISYYPEIIVYHKRRSTLGKLAKQIYNYGVTRPKKESIFETLKMPFFLVPSLFLFYLVLLMVFFSSRAVITGNVVGFGNLRILNFWLISPLILYLIINILFSLNNSISNRNLNAIWELPYIYFVIHISYGFGFLKGTFEDIFRSRKKNLNSQKERIT
tara:strand:- start:1180 stop:2172 length:993 start_codon:yes stop_codon:yes gene_type:complete